jgi:hypothetical protein
VLSKDFPPHVKGICRVVLERRLPFKDWIAWNYYRPVVAETTEEDPLGQGMLLLDGIS